MIISLAMPLGTAISALKFLNDLHQFCKHLQNIFNISLEMTLRSFYAKCWDIELVPLRQTWGNILPIPWQLPSDFYEFPWQGVGLVPEYSRGHTNVQSGQVIFDSSFPTIHNSILQESCWHSKEYLESDHVSLPLLLPSGSKPSSSPTWSLAIAF